jgi:hypothetical protein
MSAYTTVSNVVFKDKECLIEALKEILGEEKAQHLIVAEEAMPLYGYQRDQRSQKAEIVMPGSGHPSGHNIVGRASNDVGFVHQEDGTWVPIISQYDSHTYNQDWLVKLTVLAAEKKLRKDAKRLGYQVQKKINKEGKIVLSLCQA